MVNGSLKPRKSYSSSKPQEAGNLADQLLTVKNKDVYVTRDNVSYAVEDAIKASGQVILLVEEDGKPVKSDWLSEELKDATGLDVFIELEGKLYPALSFTKGTIQAKIKASRKNKASSYNNRVDTLQDYVPTNDGEFLNAAVDGMYQIPDGSFDKLITLFGEGMLDYYNKHRKKLLKLMEEDMKDIHGKIVSSKIDDVKERQAKIKDLGKELAKSTAAKSLMKEVQALVDSNPELFVNSISTSLLLGELVSNLEDSNSIKYPNKSEASSTVSSINDKDLRDLKRTLEKKFKVTAEFVQMDDYNYNVNIEGDISDSRLQAKIEGMIEMYLDADVSVDTIEDDFISFNINLSDSDVTSKKRSAPTEDRDPSNVEKEIPVPDKDKAKTKKSQSSDEPDATEPDDESIPDDTMDEPTDDIEVSTFE